MAYQNHTFGALEVGTIDSQRYAQGLTVIKEIFNDLNSIITTPSQYLRKVPLTMASLTASLKKGMTESDWQKWVIGLAEKKNLFLKIPSKKLSSYTGTSWADIIEDIANATPVSGLTTRSIIDNIFLDSGYYTTSTLDTIKQTAKATKDVAVTATKAVTGTFDFIGKTKYFLLAGALGYIIYKLLTQSDKVSKAYSTIKGDAGALYNKAKSEGKRAVAYAKANRQALRSNPKKKVTKKKVKKKVTKKKAVSKKAKKFDTLYGIFKHLPKYKKMSYGKFVTELKKEAKKGDRNAMAFSKPEVLNRLETNTRYANKIKRQVQREIGNVSIRKKNVLTKASNKLARSDNNAIKSAVKTLKQNIIKVSLNLMSKDEFNSSRLKLLENLKTKLKSKQGKQFYKMAVERVKMSQQG